MNIHSDILYYYTLSYSKVQIVTIDKENFIHTIMNLPLLHFVVNNGPSYKGLSKILYQPEKWHEMTVKIAHLSCKCLYSRQICQDNNF